MAGDGSAYKNGRINHHYGGQTRDQRSRHFILFSRISSSSRQVEGNNSISSFWIRRPPCLITDARVIGILADGVVLVTRAGQTTREALLAIQERFSEDRIHLLGCILNDWDLEPFRDSAYQYYAAEEESFA